VSAADFISDETMFKLRLRIARRADEFAQAREDTAGLNVHCWLLAEREVLRAVFPPDRPHHTKGFALA